MTSIILSSHFVSWTNCMCVVPLLKILIYCLHFAGLSRGLHIKEPAWVSFWFWKEKF